MQNANPEIVHTPPELANVEAEQELLGAIFMQNRVIILVDNLRPQHFYEPLHQRIFKAMLTAWEKGENFTPITMKSAFEHDPSLDDIGGSAYLTKLVICGTTVISAAQHAKILIDLAHRRALLKVCDDAKFSLLDETTGSASETAMALSQRIDDALTEVRGTIFQDDYEVTESILAALVRDVSPYPSGYAGLDLAMDGGLYPGKSYGFAARKKVGKTILAGSISHNLNMAGIRHLFICGEMSPEEIQKRTLARQLRVYQSVFNSRASRLPEFMKRIADVADKSPRCMIYKNAPGITLDDLKYYVLLARKQKKITGFILDYWQLVGGKPKGKSTAEHLDEVAQWIADTCRKYDLWSITMAQINQQGNTRGGEGIRLSFDQVYVLQAPGDDAGRSERWLEMSDTRYTSWRSVGSVARPGMFLNQYGPYFSETVDDNFQEPLDL